LGSLEVPSEILEGKKKKVNENKIEIIFFPQEHSLSIGRLLSAASHSMCNICVVMN